MSIPVNELRIGNWVTHNTNWSYREKAGPFQWDTQDWYAFGECTLFLENVEPIPITPEILEKCGLTDKECDGTPKDEMRGKEWSTDVLGVGVPFAIREYDDGYALMSTEPYFTLGKPFKYLHQLQNLYFALVGEELTVNLTEYQTT